MVSKNRSTKDLIHKFSNKSSKLNQLKAGQCWPGPERTLLNCDQAAPGWAVRGLTVNILSVPVVRVLGGSFLSFSPLLIRYVYFQTYLSLA